MLFRLIFWAFIIYYGFRLLKRLFGISTQYKKTEVNSSDNKRSLDLSGHDVEDADFEDIP